MTGSTSWFSRAETSASPSGFLPSRTALVKIVESPAPAITALRDSYRGLTITNQLQSANLRELKHLRRALVELSNQLDCIGNFLYIISEVCR